VVSRVVAFVIGSAACVWDDLSSARSMCTPDLTVIVNQMGIAYPTAFDCWVSYHSNLLPVWSEKRDKLNLPRAKELWTGMIRASNAPKNIHMSKNRGGSSGMLATCVALGKQATHVILIGVPMDPDMKHFNNQNQGKPWTDGKNYKHHWTMKVPEFTGRVKSMSGWTASILGIPTIEWLESTDVDVL